MSYPGLNPEIPEELCFFERWGDFMEWLLGFRLLPEYDKKIISEWGHKSVVYITYKMYKEYFDKKGTPIP